MPDFLYDPDLMLEELRRLFNKPRYAEFFNMLAKEEPKINIHVKYVCDKTSLRSNEVHKLFRKLQVLELGEYEGGLFSWNVLQGVSSQFVGLSATGESVEYLDDLLISKLDIVEEPKHLEFTLPRGRVAKFELPSDLDGQEKKILLDLLSLHLKSI